MICYNHRYNEEANLKIGDQYFYYEEENLKIGDQYLYSLSSRRKCFINILLEILESILNRPGTSLILKYWIYMQFKRTECKQSLET